MQPEQSGIPSLKENSTIQFARDHESPAKSINTRLIAAALTSGAAFATKKPFLDTIEQVTDEKTGASSARRTVTWCMDGDKMMDFAPIASAESIDFAEFSRRFHSHEWCEANGDHPIAYLRAFSEMLNRLRDKIKDMKPMALIRRGKSYALIPADCSAAKRAEILALI